MKAAICAILLCSLFLTQLSGQQAQPQGKYLLGAFQGKLPCADCSGITVRLRLFLTAPDDFTAPTYVQSMTYEGKRMKPYVQRGNWSILKGAPGKPNATVYQLDPDKPGHSTSYLRVDDNTLQQLDRDGHAITSPFPFVLHRTPNTPPSGAH